MLGVQSSLCVFLSLSLVVRIIFWRWKRAAARNYAQRMRPLYLYMNIYVYIYIPPRWKCIRIINFHCVGGYGPTSRMHLSPHLGGSGGPPHCGCSNWSHVSCLSCLSISVRPSLCLGRSHSLFGNSKRAVRNCAQRICGHYIYRGWEERGGGHILYIQKAKTHCVCADRDRTIMCLSCLFIRPSVSLSGSFLSAFWKFKACGP